MKSQFKIIFPVFFVLVLLFFAVINSDFYIAKAEMLFSEMFTGVTINTGNWVEHDTASNVNQNEELTIVGSNAWAANGVSSVQKFYRGNSLTLEVITKASATNGYSIPLAYGDWDWYPYAYGKEAYLFDFFNTGFIKILRYDNGVQEDLLTNVAYSANTWYKVQMILGDTQGATFKLYADSNGDKDFLDPGEDTDLMATANFNTLIGGTFTNKAAFSSTYSSTITLTLEDYLIADAPSVPTVNIVSPTSIMVVNDQFYNITIPWIQTSTTIAASAIGSNIPVGGGVEFILDIGTANEASIIDLSSPYTASFVSTPKGTHTIDAYALGVDGSTRVSNIQGHKQESNIAVGDIIVLYGDSTTAGSYGNSSVGNIMDCSLANYATSDCRTFEQKDGNTSNANPLAGFHVELAEKLAAYYNYPVFIMNEGWGSSNTYHLYNTIFGQAQYENRINALSPNKFIISHGVNDVRCEVNGSGLCSSGTWNSSSYGTRLQNIVDYIKTNYSATNDQIWISRFNYDTTAGIISLAPNYLSQIATVITNNSGINQGANLYDFFANHQSLLSDIVHPTVAGHTESARIWGLSMMRPQNIAVVQNAEDVIVSWNDLSSVDPSVNGYKVHYGISAGVYTTTVDAGNNTSNIISGLTPDQTYYFSVSAYDNDSFVPNETLNSTEVSLLVITNRNSKKLQIMQPPDDPAPSAKNPLGNLKVVINNNEENTAIPLVTLSFFVGDNVENIMVSNDLSFTQFTMSSYTNSLSWSLCEECARGSYSVYVKFITPYGIESKIISDSINYTPLLETEPMPFEPPVQLPEPEIKKEEITQPPELIVEDDRGGLLPVDNKTEDEVVPIIKSQPNKENKNLFVPSQLTKVINIKPESQKETVKIKKLEVIEESEPQLLAQKESLPLLQAEEIQDKSIQDKIIETISRIGAIIFNVFKFFLKGVF